MDLVEYLDLIGRKIDKSAAMGETAEVKRLLRLLIDVCQEEIRKLEGTGG